MHAASKLYSLTGNYKAVRKNRKKLFWLFWINVFYWNKIFLLLNFFKDPIRPIRSDKLPQIPTVPVDLGQKPPSPGYASADPIEEIEDPYSTLNLGKQVVLYCVRFTKLNVFLVKNLFLLCKVYPWGGAIATS